MMLPDSDALHESLPVSPLACENHHIPRVKLLFIVKSTRSGSDRIGSGYPIRDSFVLDGYFDP